MVLWMTSLSHLSRIATCGFLLATAGVSALAGDDSAESATQDAEAVIVRVNISNEISSFRDTIEINGRRLFDYSPRIIQVFSFAGVVFDDKGSVLTFPGYRWVDIQSQSQQIEITTTRGERHRGRLVGIDQSLGVAVVSTLDGTLPKTPICRHCEMESGRTVLTTAAEPGRMLQFRRTRVLSVHRAKMPAYNQEWILRLDGPSPDPGEPLLDSERKVIGFVATQDPVGGRIVALPISQMLDSATKILRAGGDIRTGWLGVFLADSRPESGRGIMISRVLDDSPAQKAGLKSRDVVLRFNGNEIQDAWRFIQLVQDTPIGSRVDLKIARHGETVSLSALVEARRQEPPRKLVFSFPEMAPWAVSETGSAPKPQPTLGFEAATLTQPLAASLRIPVNAGLLVLSVENDLPAGRGGLAAGDVIVSANGRPVPDAQSLAWSIQARGPGTRLELKVVRKGIEQSIVIRVPEFPSRENR